MAMDVVDYEIKGAEMQFVEVELDPGEAAIGEAGSMMFMDTGVEMDTVFGDGSQQSGGLFGKLLGAGKRLVTGESLFTTVYTNQTSGKATVAFAAPQRGGSREEGSVLGAVGEGWTVALAGSNLTDREGSHWGYAYSAGCVDPSVYPYTGRSWRLSVERSF